MTTILGIETSCDETAVAVVIDGTDVRSNVIASQVELHSKYGGVVPEIAARAHIERLDAVIEEAMAKPGIGLRDVDAIAVTNRPGLAGALLMGVTAAKTLSWVLGKPLIAVDHIHAHAHSPAIGLDAPPWPAIALIVSGGHTSLYRVDAPHAIERIGSTLDDAAGEAFDKVATILNLPYPGGPQIERIAKRGDVFSLEVGLVIGVLLLLGGLGVSVFAVEFWGRSEFGDLDPTVSMRIVLPGATALILGLQIIFSSFFFSVLELSRR